MTPIHDFTGGRERATNYVTICQTIADSYPDPVYGQQPVHGLQKDAIQNSKDAVAGSGPAVVEFELVRNQRGAFFVITDSHTSGLTGPVLNTKEYKEYEDELPEDYHWARFESFAFNKPSPDAIGARGQGKFIFLRCSKQYTMYYDTLRDDGVYRAGATQATTTGCPILPRQGEEPWEGQQAQQIMGELGLMPLDRVGTRVVIVDPVEEVVSTWNSDVFERSIQETWFRPIEKKQLKVFLISGNSRREVKPPALFPLPDSDTDKHKVWVPGSDLPQRYITLSGGEQYAVKRFHAVYLNSGTVPEELRGIAVIHNGMKITSQEMTSAPPQVRERVTGYIEFDRELDRELRKTENQNPNHYDLKWRKRLPNAIKEYISRELTDFGRTKLGLGADPRERRNRARVAAEEWAMEQLQKFADDLDLFGARKGRVRPAVSSSPPYPKEIGVSINNFAFPDPDIAPRVNRGHVFEELTFTSRNQTDLTRSVSLSVSVLHSDRTILQLVERERLELSPHRYERRGPFTIRIDNVVFAEPGEYRLVASLVDSALGDRVDRVARRFWVEADPPLRRPFEPSGVTRFSEPHRYRQWMTAGSVSDSPSLFYNMGHPAYRLVEDDENRQGDYLFQIFLEGALEFILKRPYSDEGEPDFHPLEATQIFDTEDKGEIPGKTYAELAGYLSRVRWKAFEEG